VLFRLAPSVSVALVLAVSAAMLAATSPLDRAIHRTTALAEAKALGSLTVTIKPKDARRWGARWRVDGGAWQKSGATVNGLSTGDHEVTFKAVAGWNAPKKKTASIQVDAATELTGKYVFTGTDTIMLPGDVPLELVWVPAGQFMMGRYENEQDSSSDEDPQHEVTLTRGFWLGKYEVTQAQWKAVKGNNPSGYTGDLTRPVEQVSWNDAQGFLTGVNALGKGAFRLPTEAEWEYAYRGGTTTRFYWGDDPSYASIVGYAWELGNSGSSTQPVGQKSPNAWGLFDMGGNVWEWCQDRYGAYPDGPVTDPAGPDTGTPRVVRGGSWFSIVQACRAASRLSIAPGDTYNTIGVRLVRTQN